MKTLNTFYTPGKLTDLVKHLFLILLICVTVNAFGEGKDAIERCNELSVRYQRGWLSRAERNDYCLFKCEFLVIDCAATDGNSQIISWVRKHFMAGLKAVMELAERVTSGDFDFSQYQPMAVEEITLNAWLELLDQLWPILLSIVPILLNQWKYYHLWLASLLILAYVIVMLSGFIPTAIAFHNILIAFLALIHSGNSGYLFESMWTLAIMICALCALFMVGTGFHVFILGSVIAGFFSYVYWCFFIKRAGVNAGLAVSIMQLLVLIEQLHFIRVNMQMHSIGEAGMEMCVRAVIPVGSSTTYTMNAAEITARIARFFGPKYAAFVFIGLFIVNMCMFLGFRACLGMFYLAVLRYKTDFASLLWGFYVYCADVVGPVRCLIRIVMRLEAYSTRRMLYAVVAGALMLYEIKYARDFFLLRCVFWAADVVLVRSKLTRVTHYLECRFDFMQQAFPHKGALPWMPVELLSAIAESTGYLTATHSNGRIVRGIGCALKSAGRTMLYTVAHIAKGCESIVFKDAIVADPDFRVVATDCDPLIAMKYVATYPAPEVELLVSAELDYVQNLLFIGAEGDEKYVCVVPEYKRTKDGFSAIVNLKRGDSGGPCFAVLQDGTVRLCGVVSRGNPRNGGGNFISFCISDSEADLNSSDEDEPVLGVTQFNAVRRRRSLDELSSRDRERLAYEVTDYLEANRETLEDLRYWKERVSWADFGCGAPTVAELAGRYSLADIRNRIKLSSTCPRLEPPRDWEERAERYHDPFYDDRDVPKDDGDPGIRRKDRRDKKRIYKDRAYRKRMLEICSHLRDKLLLVYSPKDAQIIFRQLTLGDVPKLEHRFISSFSNNSWLIVDGLDDEFGT